jgi:hypothetical protein
MANCKVGFISERRYNLTCKISVRDATSGVYRVGRRAHKLREVLFDHILYQCSLMAEYAVWRKSRDMGIRILFHE